MVQKRTLGRGVAVLAALSLVAGALIVSPVGAAAPVTKKKVKKIATKVFNQKIKTAKAGDADKLDGTDSAGFLKAGQVLASSNVNDTDIDDFTAGTFTSIISTDITAPSSGFLFITGNVSGADDASLGGIGTLRARLRLDGTAVTNDIFPYSAGSVADLRWTIGNSVVVPVTAGAHTVHLDAYESGTGSFIFIRDVSAIFVPAGSGVTIPARPAARELPESDQG